ncbi:hypothetical protein [Sodalinema gerasimenkoae]|uniref:hypothetical protein n=1 Tax=Sodalinema gerasimenkoae TaxID=2862348 RepID=UPI00135CE6D9|nr:hypothetical protein [Sodalinema gerasimenkoae]
MPTRLFLGLLSGSVLSLTMPALAALSAGGSSPSSTHPNPAAAATLAQGFEPGPADGHGPDEDEVLTEAGPLQGSWRAAQVEQDRPLAYFTIFHDRGASEADGSFLMGLAMGDGLDGEAGEIKSVQLEGDRLEITWNPTSDSQERYYLTLVQEDADLYRGSFEAERNPASFEVILERRDHS